MRGKAVVLTLDPEAVEAIAQRAAEIVLEHQRATTTDLSPWMTTREAADYLRCAPQGVHELVSRGDLTRRREGGRLLLGRLEVEALVRFSGGPVGPHARAS